MSSDRSDDQSPDAAPEGRPKPTVEVAPFSTGRQALSGFILAGRWPDDTREWAQLLMLTVQLARVPGVLPRASVFSSRDAKPELDGRHADALGHAVGMLLCDGPILGADAPEPGALGHPQPEAILLLHPPSQRRGGGAAGCVLLPGIPHLGLDHRAAWVETDDDGSVVRLLAAHDVDPSLDPDTAVMALLLAA